jgi:hypothetical protein
MNGAFFYSVDVRYVTPSSVSNSNCRRLDERPCLRPRRALRPTNASVNAPPLAPSRTTTATCPQVRHALLPLADPPPSRHPQLSHIRPSPPPSLHPPLSHTRAGLARAIGTPAAAKTPRATKSPRRAAKSPWSASHRTGPLSTPRRFPTGSRWPDDLTNIIMKFSGGGERGLANVTALQPCLHCCSFTALCHVQACPLLRALAKVREGWLGTATCGAARTTRSSPKKWR